MAARLETDRIHAGANLGNPGDLLDLVLRLTPAKVDRLAAEAAGLGA